MSIGEVEVVTLQGVATTFGAVAQGKVALVVNVASRCGLTPQYKQLEELQRIYGDAGFTVIGFPCNQFFGESGDSEKIETYCSTTWGVSFPMMEKIKVKGRSAHPLYQHLTKTEDANGKAGNVAWNFEKFLVHPNGKVLRFRPKTVPDAPEIIKAIEEWVSN